MSGFLEEFLLLCADRSYTNTGDFEATYKLWRDILLKIYTVEEVKKGVNYFILYSHELSKSYMQTSKMPTISEVVKAIEHANRISGMAMVEQAWAVVRSQVEQGAGKTGYDDIDLCVKKMGGMIHLKKEMTSYNENSFKQIFIAFFNESEDDRKIGNAQLLSEKNTQTRIENNGLQEKISER